MPGTASLPGALPFRPTLPEPADPVLPRKSPCSPLPFLVWPLQPIPPNPVGLAARAALAVPVDLMARAVPVGRRADAAEVEWAAGEASDRSWKLARCCWYSTST